MATTNFYLKPADTKGLSRVVLVYQDKGKKFKFPTKIKVKKCNWEKGKLVKGKSSIVNEINSILDGYRQDINEILREAMLNKTKYEIELVEKKFRMKIGETNVVKNEFYKTFEEFMENAKATKAHGTILNYNATLTRLKGFSEYLGQEITFKSINQLFYEGFMNYLIKEHNSLNNTVGRHIKVLKVFLNYCKRMEIIPSTTNITGFKVMKEEADIIYLTEKELFTLMNLEGLTKSLEHIRDNFCFGCFTGLRFSDIAKINKSNIKEDFIEIKSEKTRESLKIPLNQHSKSILKKYEGESETRPLPPTISNQKTNEYLKELCEIAEIDEMIEMEKFSGSKKITIKKPKYNLVSSHTARRTFVTLSLEKGIRAEVVMNMTGHKEYQTFKKYIKITDKVKLLEMNRVWDKPNLKVV
jgi:site-specific recombinase XerD